MKFVFTKDIVLKIAFFVFRIVYIGGALTQIMQALIGALAISLVYWFRDCDPELSGAIRRHDQVND